MSSPLSVGDCIAVIGLILQAVRATSDAYGAAGECADMHAQFQELGDCLKTTEKTLKSVTQLNHDTSTVERIYRTSNRCAKWLRKWLKKLAKYSSLRFHESNKLKRLELKMQWTFLVARDIPDIKATAQHYISVLNFEISNLTLLAQDTIIDTSTKQHKTIKSRLDTQTNSLALIHRDVGVCTSTLQEIMASLAIDQAGSIDTAHTWFQKPLVFEDALGHKYQFPLEFGYEDLINFIYRQFTVVRNGQARPGHEKVKAGDYELFESGNTAKMISEETYPTLTAGKGITMALIIGQYISPFNFAPICPRANCHSRHIKKHQTGDLLCLRCSACFGTSRISLPRPYKPSLFGPVASSEKQSYGRAHNGSEFVPFVLAYISAMSQIKNFRILERVLKASPLVKNVRFVANERAHKIYRANSRGATTLRSHNLHQLDTEIKEKVYSSVAVALPPSELPTRVMEQTLTPPLPTSNNKGLPKLPLALAKERASPPRKPIKIHQERPLAQSDKQTSLLSKFVGDTEVHQTPRRPPRSFGYKTSSSMYPPAVASSWEIVDRSYLTGRPPAQPEKQISLLPRLVDDIEIRQRRPRYPWEPSRRTVSFMPTPAVPPSPSVVSPVFHYPTECPPIQPKKQTSFLPKLVDGVEIRQRRPRYPEEPLYKTLSFIRPKSAVPPGNIVTPDTSYRTGRYSAEYPLLPPHLPVLNSQQAPMFYKPLSLHPREIAFSEVSRQTNWDYGISDNHDNNRTSPEVCFSEAGSVTSGRSERTNRSAPQPERRSRLGRKPIRGW